ncbi:MAG: hypothetical protein AAF135_27400, partial [Bacteroidota bacterium]
IAEILGFPLDTPQGNCPIGRGKIIFTVERQRVGLNTPQGNCPIGPLAQVKFRKIWRTVKSQYPSR